MVSHLAQKLVRRYAAGADHLVDPFCGSGAILHAGICNNVRVTGVDINPFAVLLSKVKIQGFRTADAMQLCDQMLCQSKSGDQYSLQWPNASYWFTPATLRKYEQIRAAARELKLWDDPAGRAVLLAFALSVRLCSRSDQRSPKPFISKTARSARRGRHFDPRATIRGLVSELADVYGGLSDGEGCVYNIDIVNADGVHQSLLSCSHIVTSPPYLNAQDYFRNSKLELYMLEGLLPFRVKDIINRFVGTERGLGGIALAGVTETRYQMLPGLRDLEGSEPHRALIVHKYLDDMDSVFHVFRTLLRPGGTLVMVCGDNLVGGKRIVTWRVIGEMLEALGFGLFDRFEDVIKNRTLAPFRKGHKGLIKQEVISAYRLRT